MKFFSKCFEFFSRLHDEARFFRSFSKLPLLQNPFHCKTKRHLSRMQTAALPLSEVQVKQS